MDTVHAKGVCSAAADDTGETQEGSELSIGGKLLTVILGVVDEVHILAERGALRQLYDHTLGVVLDILRGSDDDVVVDLDILSPHDLVVRGHLLYACLYRADDVTLGPGAYTGILCLHSLLDGVGVILLTFLVEHHVVEAAEQQLPLGAVV